MRLAIFFAVMSYALNGYCGEDKWKEKRTRRIGQIDEKINMLQELKSCMQQASLRTEFKACKEKHKATMQSFKKTQKDQKKK